MKLLLKTIALLVCITTACKNKPMPSANTDTTTSVDSCKNDMTKKNKETVLAFLQSINEHKVDEVVKNLALDFVEYNDGTMQPVRGLDSVKAELKISLKAFPDIKGENLIAIAEDNQVAVFGDWSGTFKGELYSLKPTGKSFTIKSADLFTFNDEGQIAEHRTTPTNLEVMIQVGIIDTCLKKTSILIK